MASVPPLRSWLSSTDSIAGPPHASVVGGGGIFAAGVRWPAVTENFPPGASHSGPGLRAVSRSLVGPRIRNSMEVGHRRVGAARLSGTDTKEACTRMWSSLQGPFRTVDHWPNPVSLGTSLPAPEQDVGGITLMRHQPDILAKLHVGSGAVLTHARRTPHQSRRALRARRTVHRGPHAFRCGHPPGLVRRPAAHASTFRASTLDLLEVVVCRPPRFDCAGLALLGYADWSSSVSSSSSVSQRQVTR